MTAVNIHRQHQMSAHHHHTPIFHNLRRYRSCGNTIDARLLHGHSQLEFEPASCISGSEKANSHLQLQQQKHHLRNCHHHHEASPVNSVYKTTSCLRSSTKKQKRTDRVSLAGAPLYFEDVNFDDESEEDYVEASFPNYNKRVQFADVSIVVEIPHHEEYSLEQRDQMWIGLDEINRRARRNLIEFRWEGGDWRHVVEDESFFEHNGIRLHPAHVPADYGYSSEEHEHLYMYPEEEQLKQNLATVLVEELTLGIF